MYEICTKDRRSCDLFISDDISGDQVLHDLVRAAIDHLHARVCECTCDAVLPHVAPAAVQLKALCCYTVLQLRGPKMRKKPVQVSENSVEVTFF